MRAPFYAAVTNRLFRGSLPEWQQLPLDRIVDEGVARGRSVEDTAYVLATAYHETGRFKHMEEIGRGEGKAYGEPVPLMGTGSRVTHQAVYYGRGFVQLTWLQNYAAMSVYAGVDLVGKPDRAAEPEVAAKVLWEGMIRGTFTGKNLADYINDGGVDYVGARRIVNGTDRDDLIAGYARQFEAALAAIDPNAAPAGCDRAGCPLAEVA